MTKIDTRLKDLEEDVNIDIAKGFRIINILLTLIGIVMLFIGYFCYEGYNKGNQASEKAATLTVRFDEHERMQRIWENSIINKEQYCLSTKLLFLNIQDIKAILAGNTARSLKIEEEIRQLESKILIQEIDDVTRGAK
jgi:hypothetical protein